MYRFIAGLILLFSLRASAQQPLVLTLDGALARARESAPAVAAARIRIDEARGRLSGASLLVTSNPTVDVVGGRRTGATSNDQVVCCYPDHQPLLEAALRHATHGLAFSYPKDRWFVRVAVRLENAMRRLRSNPFRTVVHPVRDMQRIIEDGGFELASRSGTMAWAVDVYRRR